MIRLIFVVLVSSLAASASAQTQAPAQKPAQPPTPASMPAETSTPAEPPTDAALPVQEAFPTQATTRAPGATPAPAPKTLRVPPQTLMVTMSLSGGNGDDSTSGNSGSMPVAGFHTDGDAIVNYQRKSGRVTFGAIGRSVVRYMPSSPASTSTTTYDQGDLLFSVANAHNRLEGHQMVSYSPYYQFGAFPGAFPSATDSALTDTAQSHGDFANTDLNAFTSTTDVNFFQAIGRRDTLALTYDLRRTVFDDPNLDLTSQGVRVRLLHRLSRSLALRTGYGYQSANSAYTPGGLAQNHDIDLGLDYSRALGPSKRTTFSVGSGASATPNAQGTAYNVTGNAALARQIGRTWRARIGANRSVQMLEGFAEPALTNRADIDIDGKVSRRVNLSATVGYSLGMIGFGDPGANDFANWTGAVGLSIMLSRWTALETQYSYYGHRFDQGVLLPPGLVSGLRRQGLRVSLTWLHPVLQ